MPIKRFNVLCCNATRLHVVIVNCFYWKLTKNKNKWKVWIRLGEHLLQYLLTKAHTLVWNTIARHSLQIWMTTNAPETPSMMPLPCAEIRLDHCFLSQTPKNRNSDVTGPACWGIRSCDTCHLYAEHTRSIILCVIL